MHSRIFQVSLNPIDREDYIGESNYWDHWFTREWADYVSENCNRDDDIEWLKDCYVVNGLVFGVDDNGEYFIVKSKQECFEKKFHKFMKILDTIKQCTLDDFAGGFHEMWQLKNAYEEKVASI